MKKGNRPQIIFTIIIFSLMFAALGTYIFIFVVRNEKVLINNNYNLRQQTLSTRNYRGTIYANEGEILATTILDEDENETREYPYGSTFAHVVGYSTKGRMGIEALANYWLMNSHISVSGKVNNAREGKKNPGDNVYSTLDTSLQQIADDYLSFYSGAAIVTNVKTGEILAMVSHPDFDPNEIENIWDSVIKSDSTVLLNRSTQGLYAPGSTFKMFTALEYYKENTADWDEFIFDCNGYVVIDDARINCIRTQSHGSHLDFALCFAKSCNSAFATIGMTLDRKRFQNTLDQLLFNSDLGIDLPSVKSSIHISKETSTDEMMQTSFGQGKTLVTPMLLNMVTMAIANQGVLIKPHVIDHIENADGEIMDSYSNNMYEKQLLTQEEASFMTEIMTGVVEQGTAKRMKDLPYSVAGKTGSAEYNAKGDSHAWFTAFAPVEDPEIAVTIIVESSGTGTEYAIPLATRLFNDYFSTK